MDKSVLAEKYLEQRLSTNEIANRLGASKSTILKYLKLHGIRIRPTGSNIRKRPGYGLAYGRRIASRKEVANKREQEHITRMKELRAKGFSYWKIADAFNTLRIRTKTGRGRWHARSIQQILDTAQAWLDPSII
jgi:hypothetical protein